MSLLIKRLFILLLLAGLTWLTVFAVFPIAEDRLPLALALLVTYAFVAYIGLPMLIRIWHFANPPTHVPTRTIAGDGWAVDPINIVMLAHSEKELVRAMKKAGWLKADPSTLRNKMRMGWAILLNQPYSTAPFGPYYVFGRKQDLGFQMAITKSPRDRHHVRFWRLGTTILDDHEHHGFWRNLLQKFLGREKQIWVGAAVEDKGISIYWRNLQLNHGIESNTSTERDFLVACLKKADVLKDCTDIKAGEPLHTTHQNFGEIIIADGYVKLCELKRQPLPPPTNN